MSWAHRIDRPQKIDLSKFDPNDTLGLDKEQAKEAEKEYGKELDDLEDILYFAAQHSLLIVLQGMDTAGKDGLIRCLLKYCNALGGHVWPFKVPTPTELAHDFLWRVHQRTPGKGEFAVFNRSHYEDVLVVRVHNLVPEPVWQARYDHINAFERLVADSKTIVVKIFLHIDKAEQEERLFARELEAEKAWKLSVGDWKERERWDDYQRAYEDAIGKTSFAHAPWHIVPANKKWFRDAAVLRLLVETLRPYRDEWMAHLEVLGETAKAELTEFRKGR